MKNLLSILFLILTITLNSQSVMTRTIEVKDGQMDNFIKWGGKKTKMFNNEDGRSSFYTFNILTGPNAGKIWRAQVGDPASFDNDYQDELDYWAKNVSQYIENDQSSRTAMWNRVGWASWSPENPSNEDLLRRVIFYKVKEGKGQDFWRFRERQVMARNAMEIQMSRTTVLACSSGCDGNWVAVFFDHSGFEDQQSDYGEPLQALIEKYNEMFGPDSYDQDGSRVEAAVEERRIRHMRLIPELSSDN
ncbi:hypothetical protein OAI59_03130 [Flavobacteriaceae bacterium]|jgi:hypothetical protein|nr:hypothetical protein [Flavobacteriaceae bacterium]|tara:strand:- start:51 stop:791 length:741 start_codon:yes stop_codon:yes gene_type:complete